MLERTPRPSCLEGLPDPVGFPDPVAWVDSKAQLPGKIPVAWEDSRARLDGFPGLLVWKDYEAYSYLGG